MTIMILYIMAKCSKEILKAILKGQIIKFRPFLVVLKFIDFSQLITL